jgi:hypothetical protein
VHLGLDANTCQVRRAAQMTHQDVADGDFLAEQLNQIQESELLDIIGIDGPTTPSRATPGSLRDGAAQWPENTSGGTRRNDRVDAIARLGRRDWKKGSG